MKWLIKKILTVLPEETRCQIIRNRARVPEIAWSKEFTVEIARTKEDLEQAYGLLYQCYVGIKAMKPHASKLGCNWYSTLPHTTVVVVKHQGQIVGTVSLIKDSPQGLPSDSDFKIENDRLRRQKNTLVEISAFAVEKKFRDSGHGVSILLMKYLFNYSQQLLKAHRIICTVHPRAEDFYKSLWHFDRNGRVVEYGFAQGALAVHLSMEISVEKTKEIVASYNSNDIKKNLALFVLNVDSRFKYPSREPGQALDPVMTPELLRYFFVEKTHLLDEIPNEKTRYLFELYKGVFGLDRIRKIISPRLKLGQSRAYRVPVEVTAFINSQEQTMAVQILDLTTEGCYITIPASSQLMPGEFSLIFKLGILTFQIPCQCAWINTGHVLTYPYGAGIQFKNKANELSESLRSIMLPKSIDFGLLDQQLLKSAY